MNGRDALAVAEPVPRTRPATGRRPRTVRWVGALRIPLALSVRPWAHLYAGPDGSVWWTVRLWTGERAELRVVPTAVLLDYAVTNRMPELARSVAALLERAGAEGHR